MTPDDVNCSNWARPVERKILFIYILCRSGVIALFAWAPHTNSGIYIVKSAMRLINNGSGTALYAI
jgi:hypothetical protein